LQNSFAPRVFEFEATGLLTSNESGLLTLTIGILFGNQGGPSSAVLGQTSCTFTYSISGNALWTYKLIAITVQSDVPSNLSLKWLGHLIVIRSSGTTRENHNAGTSSLPINDITYNGGIVSPKAYLSVFASSVLPEGRDVVITKHHHTFRQVA
jgi:hypothetical protein